jgi:hypothetical protein
MRKTRGPGVGSRFVPNTREPAPGLHPYLTLYVLFKCDWADIQPNKGYKKDEYGFDLVNFKNLIHTGARLTDDPFVLPNQVSQVYYVEDPKNLIWAVAVRTKPRNVYDVGNGESDDYVEANLS